MMKMILWLVRSGVGLTLLVGLMSACAAASPTVLATAYSSPSIAPAATQTLLPSASATPAPSATASFTPAATATLTLTPTPTITPTRTPSYNMPGLYPVGRCKDFQLTYADPSGGPESYTGTVNLCVASVLVRDDFKLQFNVVFHFASTDVPVPHRYVFGNMGAMSLTDDLGNRYAPLANSGQAPDNDEPGYGANSTGGWYLFPRPNKAARAFTLHDEDRKIDIPFIILVYQ